MTILPHSRILYMRNRDMTIAEIPPIVQLTGRNVAAVEPKVIWSFPCPSQGPAPPTCRVRTLPYTSTVFDPKSGCGSVLSLRYNSHRFFLIVPDLGNSCPTLVEHQELPPESEIPVSFHGVFRGVVPVGGHVEGLILISNAVQPTSEGPPSCKASVVHKHIVPPTGDPEIRFTQMHVDADEYSGRVCCVSGRVDRDSNSADERFVLYTFQ